MAKNDEVRELLLEALEETDDRQVKFYTRHALQHLSTEKALNELDA